MPLPRHPAGRSTVIKYVNRARRFVGFLAECGAVTLLEQVPPPPDEDVILAFQAWLRRHRGISERTVWRHGRMVMRLLPALGPDPMHTMLLLSDR